MKKNKPETHTQETMNAPERKKLMIISIGLLFLTFFSSLFGIALLSLMQGLNGLVMVTAPVLLLIAVLLIFVMRKYVIDIIRNTTDVFTGTVQTKQVSPGITNAYYISFGSEFHKVNATQFGQIQTGDVITIRKTPKVGMTLQVIIQD